MKVPQYVLDIARILQEHGYEAYLVGGSLRDLLLDREPKDYDLTTNALPENIQSLFPKSIATGIEFGTIIVLIADEHGMMHEVEVTTYRKEKDYIGGRWPSKVEFSTQLSDDLKRRDFTINALAYPLHQKQNENIEITEIVDLFGGQSDLKSKVIKAVGKAQERFEEDGLRALRACRLASVLGFTIEAHTLEGIKNSLQITQLVSRERVRVEFQKLVEESPKPSVGIELMRETGLLELFIPELLEGYGVEQNKFHSHDVYQHLLDCMDIAPKEIRMAALFHDIAKPRTKEGESFHSHDEIGASMTTETLTRLKFPKKYIEEVAKLVKHHMFFVPLSSKAPKVADPTLRTHERNKAFKVGWSEPALRRLINELGGDENIENLIKLRIADAASNPKSSFDPTDIQILSHQISKLREEDSFMSIKNLQINGTDLMQLGIPEGKYIKETLEYLLEEVIEDINCNVKEKLVELATKYAQQQGFLRV